MKDLSYKSYVLEAVADYCPFKKRSKFTYSYYYDMFIHVLKNMNSWNSLCLLSSCKSSSKYHYTTLRKMFDKWVRFNVFEIAYNKMLNDLSLIDIFDTDIDLFIDSTFISNKTGSELVRANPLYYKKNVTKVTIICDSNKIPLSIVPFKPNVNDQRTIIDSINRLNLNKKRINLIGDKGFIVNKNKKLELLKNHNVKLIVPKKKNQKNTRISKLMRSKLMVRNKVENCIQSLKAFNRIAIRRDRKISNYLGFLFLGAGLIVTKYMFG